VSPGCGGVDPAGEVVRLRRMTAAATSRRRGRILEEPVRQEGERRGRAEPPAGTDAEEPEKRGPGTARGAGRRILPWRSAGEVGRSSTADVDEPVGSREDGAD